MTQLRGTDGSAAGAQVYRRSFKRAVDVVFGGVTLLILAPLLAVVSVAVYTLLGSPVLFRQSRPGLHGRPFTLVKFRTMRDGEASDAERLTRFGRWLRATSIDELPELWNVVRGDMSLVGPRPLLLDYLPLYSVTQRRRHDVRPGLTGWAQVHGRNRLEWTERLERDVWYADNVSFSLDVRIVLMTIRDVLRGSGVTQEGFATVERFGGSVDSGSVTRDDGAR